MSFSFGKYRFRPFDEVAKIDPAYCVWCINNLSDRFPEVSQLTNLVDLNSTYITFGKHKNKTIKQIKLEDPKYIDFLKKSDYVKNKRQDILDELS